MQAGEPFFEIHGSDRIKHAHAGDEPAIEGFRARCGSTVFRNRAALFHPLLPARPCPGCYPAQPVPARRAGATRGG